MMDPVAAALVAGEEEARRLEKEEAEHHQALPRMERALVYVDDSANGRLAARLAGMFALAALADDREAMLGLMAPDVVPSMDSELVTASNTWGAVEAPVPACTFNGAMGMPTMAKDTTMLVSRRVRALVRRVCIVDTPCE